MKEGKGGGEGEKKILLSPRPLPAPLDSLHFLFSSGSFNMALSQAKTFAHPKKTPALQATPLGVSFIRGWHLFIVILLPSAAFIRGQCLIL